MNKELNSDSSLELARWIAQVLDRKGGQEIMVIDTKESGSYVADYLVLATGTSQRHMETLLDSPCRELKQSGFPPLSVEGEDTHWYLADLGDVVLHIFDDEARKNFDLEKLWESSPRVDWDTKKSRKLVQV